MTSYAAVVLDLGGVLIDVAGHESLVRFSKNSSSAAAFDQAWKTTADLRDRFEMGRCSSADFAEAAISSLNLKLSTDAFISEYRRLIRQAYPGARALLSSVSDDVTLACLTNTNPAHWATIREDLDLYDLFHHHFLSFELGLKKPDPAIFEAALASLGCSAEEVVYVDDNPSYVDAGRSCGLPAFQCEGLGQTRATLLSLGLLI